MMASLGLLECLEGHLLLKYILLTHTFQVDEWILMFRILYDVLDKQT